MSWARASWCSIGVLSRRGGMMGLDRGSFFFYFVFFYSIFFEIWFLV